MTALACVAGLAAAAALAAAAFACLAWRAALRAEAASRGEAAEAGRRWETVAGLARAADALCDRLDDIDETLTDMRLLGR